MAEEKKEEVQKVAAAGIPMGFIAILIVAFLLTRASAPKKEVIENPSGVSVATQATTNENLQFTRLLRMPNNEQIAVRVADNSDTRRMGLSGFSHLPDNEGMLFVFAVPGTYEFWMKDMKFAIDIIWMQAMGGGQYQVVSMKERISPETYPEHFGPGNNTADAVLELAAGRAQTLGIFPGAIIR